LIVSESPDVVHTNRLAFGSTLMLHQVVDLAANCQRAYRLGGANVRRLYSQVFFERIFIDQGGIASAHLAEPFAQLLAHDVAARFTLEASNPDQPSLGRGSSYESLVEAAGTEPPSTLRSVAGLRTKRVQVGVVGQGERASQARHHRGITSTSFGGIRRRLPNQVFRIAMQKTAYAPNPRVKNPAYRSANGKPRNRGAFPFRGTRFGLWRPTAFRGGAMPD
jgi:hypothetical protein